MTMTRDIVIHKLDTATLALSECKSAMEAKQIADVAEMARVYLERTNASVETVNRATEVRLLAERQMGEFLKAMPKNHGVRTTGGGEGAGGTMAEPPADVPTLREIGISKKQSSQAQKLADIPEPEFKERVAVAKIGGAKLTVSKVLEPTIPPVMKRRARAEFDMRDWQDQTRFFIETRFRFVPSEHRAEAQQFLAKLAQQLGESITKP